MRRIISTQISRHFRWLVFLTLTLILTIGWQVTVFADDPVLTVDTSLNVQNQEAEAEAAPEPTPIPWVWHPISVIHDEVNGFHTIRKTYALPADVNPAVIPTDDISMFGQPFVYGYMVQQPTAYESSMEVRQTVTVETATAALNDILPNLATEMRFERDGYAGVLSLDVQSIRSESAGTASRNATVTRRRTYPHLSHQCNSLIPTSIVDGGITLNLTSVEWVGNSSSAIDGLPVASTFTAHATYTTSITQTSTIGYVTTADYVGVVSRTVQGKTLYTVVFIGTTVVHLPAATPGGLPGMEAGGADTSFGGNGNGTTDSGSQEASTGLGSGAATSINTGTTASPNSTQPPGEAAERSINFGPVLRVLGILLLLALVGAGVYYFVKRFLGNSVTVYGINGPREIVKVGKTKIDVGETEAVISLDSLVGSNPSKTGRYLIQIAERAISKIDDKNVRVMLRGNEANYYPPEGEPSASITEFEVNFSQDV